MATDSSRSADLVAYAREAALQTDLFEMLGVDATSTREDIHRAWRRKGLKYHPDKAGANFDADKYESFERARDVLTDPVAREAYDRARSAALQEKKRRDEMSSERRRFAEELEAAERAGVRARMGKGGAVGGDAARGVMDEEDAAAQKLTPAQRAERERSQQEGARRVAERMRALREAEDRDKAREAEQWAKQEARIAEIEQILREKGAKREAKARRKPATATAVDAEADGLERGGSATPADLTKPDDTRSRLPTATPEPAETNPWPMLENATAIVQGTIESISAMAPHAGSALEISRSAQKTAETSLSFSEEQTTAVEEWVTGFQHWLSVARSARDSAVTADRLLLEAAKALPDLWKGDDGVSDLDARWERRWNRTKAMAMTRQSLRDLVAAAAAAEETMAAATETLTSARANDSESTGVLTTALERWSVAAEQWQSTLTKAGSSAGRAGKSLQAFVAMSNPQRPLNG